MKNASVQERLFIEPKDSPEEALKFATAFQQEAQQKKTECVKPINDTEEPVLAVEKNTEH